MWWAQLRYRLLSCSLRRHYHSSIRIPCTSSVYHSASVCYLAPNGWVCDLLRRISKKPLHPDVLETIDAGVLVPAPPHAGLTPNQWLDVQECDCPAPSPQMKQILRCQLNSDPLHTHTISGVWEFSWNGTLAWLHLPYSLHPLPCRFPLRILPEEITYTFILASASASKNLT